MTTFGIAMVKDEADIIASTVRRMLEQVDHIIVADNGSTDGTRELLDTLDVDVMDDPETGYYQAVKMTNLAKFARERGATWVVPFDADEVWCAADGRRIADLLMDLPEWIDIAAAGLFDHVATAIDSEENDPVVRLQWRRRHCVPLPKVACRIKSGLAIQQGNHGANYGQEWRPATVANLITAHHFPYRSPEQFVRKVRNGAAAYAATDLPENVGAHWRSWGNVLNAGGEEAVIEVFRKWYWREIPAAELWIDDEHQERLIHDPCPSLS